MILAWVRSSVTLFEHGFGLKRSVEKPEQIAIALEESSCRFKARDMFGLFDPLVVLRQKVVTCQRQRSCCL